MKTMKNLNVPMMPWVLLLAVFLAMGWPVATQQPAATIPASHFHHLHLNSVNPAAAVDTT